ncbi:MAG: thioredoxin family protein [Planctomycetes bacterium]|nr:thioredoxin family protein [Planctomycetota bacterium]
MKKLEVLGSGCPKCFELARRCEAAAAELGIEVKVEKVTSIERMMELGLMVTPGLAIDGVLKTTGHVPTVAVLKDLLKE